MSNCAILFKALKAPAAKPNQTRIDHRLAASKDSLNRTIPTRDER